MRCCRCLVPRDGRVGLERRVSYTPVTLRLRFLLRAADSGYGAPLLFRLLLPVGPVVGWRLVASARIAIGPGLVGCGTLWTLAFDDETVLDYCFDLI